MTARQSMLMVIVAALAFGWASSAGAATEAQKCEAFKNTAGRGESLVPVARAREAGAREAA